jgi:hypothetical protein
MSDIRRRIEALEAVVPEDIILTLRNGGKFRFDGEPLDFYIAGLEAARKRKGPLYEALRKTENATGCGNLWQVLVVAAMGPIENTPPPSPAPKQVRV